MDGLEAWIEKRSDGSIWWFVYGSAPGCEPVDVRECSPDETTAKINCIKAQAWYLMQNRLNQNQYIEPEVRDLSKRSE